MNEISSTWQMLDPTSRAIFTCLAVACVVLAVAALVGQVTTSFVAWVVAIAFGLGVIGGVIEIADQKTTQVK